jgi:hypothetical protein
MPIPNIGAILGSNIQIGGNQIETAVAKAYLTLHVNDFDRVEFNVGLGPGLVLGPGYSDWVQRSATASTKPRADMILYRGNTATIVEVKGRISGSAMGQLLTYWHILREDNPQLSEVYKVVAGNTIQDGLPPIFDRYGITIELFPAATPTAATSPAPAA